MLETLVSSKTRRTLFEYLLTHSQDRFYLRGLAKELDLSVSPLRRELKRLERAGMLKAVHEANVVFYMVNPDSPAFLQLKQAGLSAAPGAAQAELSALSAVPSRTGQAAAQAEPKPMPMPHPVPHQPLTTEPPTPQLTDRAPARPAPSFWTSPLRTPAMVGVAGVGMALMLIIAGLFYLTVTNQQLVSTIARWASTLAAPADTGPSASGVMRGTRWQLVPGGFGGFSTGASQEVY